MSISPEAIASPTVLPLENPATWEDRLSRFVPIVAVFIAVFGSKLWLVRAFGSDVPFWDQWNAEGLLLYKPLLEHGVRAVDWFAAHNEHRIFTARVTSALLLLINQQWDPLVQMCWEAACAGAIAALFAAIADRLLPGDRRVGALTGLAIIGIALPYGWENSLAGFQTPFYYLVFLSLLAFYLAAYRADLSWRRALALCGIGGLCLVTLASGALTCAAVACSMSARLILVRESRNHRTVGTVVMLIVLTLIGFGTTPTLPYHAALRAHSLTEAVIAFDMVMGWPSTVGLLIWIPFCGWAISIFLRRRLDGAGYFLIALAAFVFLNSAAMATARASSIHDYLLESRYTDLGWLSWLVNLMAVVLLMKSTGDRAPSPLRFLVVAAAFVYAGSTLLPAGLLGLEGARARGQMYATESTNTRNYVVTGNFAHLTDKSPLDIPYPDPATLREELDDPTIRALLPPGIRPGILQRSSAGLPSLLKSGLVLTGVPPGTPPAPPPDLGYFFGTWDGKEQGDHKVRFTSLPVHSEGAYIKTLVSGFAGRPGLNLYLEDIVSGRRQSLVPESIPGAHWSVVNARVPGANYRLVVEDDIAARDGWFAFTDPVEIGRLRTLAERLIENGEWLMFVGTLLFFASTTLRPGLRRASAAPS